MLLNFRNTEDTVLNLLIRAGVGASIFTILTGFVLTCSDYLLSLYLPEYERSGHYGMALALFFVFAAAFLLFGRARGWNNWRYFIIGPVAIFIPLVFIATSVRYLFGIENAFTSHHIATQCAGSTEMCGEAFAYVFFSMSLRAFPTTLIVPPLYWFCLLYTSPSPRDQRGSRMPSSA